MRAIQLNKENEKELEVLLKDYIGCEYVFTTMYPSNEEYIPIIAKNRDKVIGCEVNLFAEDLGILKITVNTKTIGGYLKEFLESANIVVLNSIFCKSLMLVFDVKLNVLHGINSLGYVKFEKQLHAQELCRELEITYNTESQETIFEYITAIFNKLKPLINDSRYKLLLQLSEPLAYSSYFGIMNDIDFDILSKYKEVVKANFDKCDKENIEKYKIDFNSPKALYELLSNVSGENITCTTKKAMISYALSENKDFADLASRVIYTRNLHKQYREINMHFDSMHYTVHNNYRLKQKFNVTDKLPSLKYLDVVHTNEKKSYYILALTSQFEYRIAEKLTNNVEFTGDYHLELASKVFNKPVSEVTKKEHRKAKVYNFLRAVDFFKMKNYVFDVKAEFTPEEFAMFVEKAPNFDNSENKSMFVEQLIMEKIIKFNEVVQLCRVDTKPSIVLNSMEYRDLVFKVDNNVNPYRALKLIADALDTTSNIDMRVYNTFRVGNTYKDFVLYGETVKDLSYSDILTGYNNITQEKVRNVVNEVYKK